MIDLDNSLKTKTTQISSLLAEQTKQAQHQVDLQNSFSDKIQKLEKKLNSVSFEDSRKPFTQKNLTFFLHYHKAGGTTVCKLARLAGFRGNYNRNCNVMPDQHCCGKTIEEQQDFAYDFSHKYDIVASEHGLEDEIDFEFYNYVTILRHPYSRAQSHYNFIKDYFIGRPSNYIVYADKLKNLNILSNAEKIQLARKMRANVSRLDDIAKSMLKPADDKIPSFSDWLKCQQDNYFTRMTCGRKCSQIVRGGLTREHLKIAKSRLAKFDAVLILENIEESYLILKNKLNWNYSGSSIKSYNRGSGVHNEDYVKLIEEDKTLRELFTLDLELYYYARYLSQTQIEEYVYRKNYSKLKGYCSGFDEFTSNLQNKDSPRSCCCQNCSFW